MDALEFFYSASKPIAPPVNSTLTDRPPPRRFFWDVQAYRKYTVFRDFLTFLKEEKKLGRKTLKKHETSCHALGGYIINDLYDSYTPSGDKLKFGEELLLAYDIRYEAPLIHHDRESWQNEVDATCRQLYKFLNR